MDPLVKYAGENPRACPYLDVQAIGATTSLSPSRNRSSQSDCRVSANVRIVLLSQGPELAIVASEVRTLASRSARAAKETEGLIGESIKLVDLGSDGIATAGEIVCTIVDTAANVTHIMQEIVATSGEQSRGITQASQAVSEVGKVTQQNTSLVEEASTVAVSSEEQTARLAEAVDAFRLNRRSVSAEPRGARESVSLATM